MTFFQKSGKVLKGNMTFAIVFIVAFIFFLYFAGGDMIGGLLTSISALVAYISGAELVAAYKKLPSGKTVKATTKKPGKKK